MKTTFYVMSTYGLRSLARKLLVILRPEFAAELRRQCGRRFENVRQSSMLEGWKTLAEDIRNSEQSCLKVECFYTKTRKPVSITIDESWFE